MARIYIETTVISFYHNVRPQPEMVARQNWTRRWLDSALQSSNELVASLAVVSELIAGKFPNKADMLQLTSRFPLLDVEAFISDGTLEQSNARELRVARFLMVNHLAATA